jgi:hypothetical protein
MEMLEVCLKATHFQVDDKVFQQKDGMAMESCHLTLATFTWSILRIWLSTQQYTNCHWGSATWMTNLRSGLAAQSSYKISCHLNSLRSTIQFTMEIVRQCDSLLGCSCHQEGGDTNHQSLQKAQPHWMISQFQF